MTYDVILVGGGIAGLYLAHLLHRAKYGRIMVLEKSDTLGGRIQTHQTKWKGEKYIYEEGASRFNNRHVLLLELLKQLKLEKHIFPIASHMSYSPVPAQEPSKIKQIQANIARVIRDMKKESKETLQSTIFTEYAQKRYSTEEIEEMTNSTGYYAEYTRMNAFDFLQLYEVWMHPDIQYYALRCGLHTVIESLEKNLSDKIDIRKGESGNVIRIERIRNDRQTVGYYIHTPKRIYKTRCCVLALPKHALLPLSILRPLQKELRSIDEVSLCRIYSFYHTPWWKPMKTTTNTPLRMVIPIRDHLIMSSYTDDIFADAWARKRKAVPVLAKELTKYTRRVFGEAIEEPAHCEMFYWKYGVGCWKKNTDSTSLYDRILRPFPHDSLYICGENYSHQQGWIEGALQTARDVCHSILSNSKTPDSYY